MARLPKGSVKSGEVLLRGVRTWDDLPTKLKRAKAAIRKRSGKSGYYTKDVQMLEEMPKGPMDELDRQMNILTVQEKAGGWIENLRANLPRIVEACKDQVNRMKPIEGAAIVAGGSNPHTPLIQRQIGLLHNGCRLPIIACDRAFSILAEPGHVPEVAVVLENNRDPNYDYLLGDGRRKLSKDSTLYATVVTHPDILADWKGDIILFRHDFPDEILNLSFFVNYLFEPLPPVWHGGNVGTASYMVAAMLHANPIGLVGMDFGIETGHVDPRKGRQFLTEPVLMAYAQAFASAIKGAASVGIRTVNCTGGGILMSKSIEVQTLEAFLKEEAAS